MAARLAVSASPGNLLEIQILRHLLRPPELEGLCSDKSNAPQSLRIPALSHGTDGLDPLPLSLQRRTPEALVKP